MELYDIWLTLAMGYGKQSISDLLEELGSSKAVYDASAEELARYSFLTTRNRKALQEKDLTRARQIVARAAELGHQIITYAMESYPPALLDIYAKPIVLYVWGEVSVLSKGVLFGIVGTRTMDAYGATYAEKIGGNTAEAGMTVVTGLARGIDIMAHRGALAKNAPTVGILGSGLDILYPAEHRRYMLQTAETGALITEFPYGMRPLPGHFPIRNRILAGLCQGVAVIQAPEKSGALITAGYALDQGKDLFVLPGNLDADMQRGSNRLIEDGAHVISNEHAIEEYYEDLLSQVLGDRPKPQKPPENVMPFFEEHLGGVAEAAAYEGDGRPCFFSQGLTDTEARVYHSLKNTPMDIEEIMTAAGTSFRETAATLTVLELKGKIRALPQSRFLKD